MNHERRGNWFFALVRALLGCALLAAAVGAGIYFWLDHKANKRWAEVEAMLTREGETLNYVDLLPMRMPEAENFAAMEELRDIATVVDGDDQNGVPAEKRKALAKMREGMEVLRSSMGDRLTGKRPDWAGLAQELHAPLRLPLASGSPANKAKTQPGLLKQLPPPGQEAAAVRAMLEEVSPLFKKLADRAMHYTQAQMVPPMRERPLPANLLKLPMPHYQALTHCAFPLRLHAAAAAEAGDGAAAVADVCAVLLLAQSVDDEPVLIGNLVAMTYRAIALEMVWDVFYQSPAQRGLGEAELAHLQTLLGRWETDRALLNALRGEMIFGLNSLDWMAGNLAERKAIAEANPVAFNTLPYRFIEWLPDSVFTLNKATLAEMEMEFYIRPLKRGMGIAPCLSKFKDIERFFEGPREQAASLDRAFVEVVFSAVHLIAQKNLQAEVNRQQALLACALERHFLKHGGYPAELGALVPAFLPELPADPWAAGKQPLGYRQTANGRYMIWSVGPDGVDDSGVVNFKSPEAPRGKDLLEEGYKGDWTWQYGQGD